MIYGLILAGGSGNRMGTETPKQFIEINGKPIIIHTIDVFINHRGMDGVIVLVPEGHMDHTKRLINDYFGKFSDIHVVAGGTLRNDTIMNGVEFIEKHLESDDETIVVTHDAVRPFVTSEIIDRNIDAMDKFKACDTVIPATDTIVHSTDNIMIADIPDRSELYQGQTPQTFNMKRFKELYISLTEHEKEILTDAAKVFVIRGEQVALVKGAPSNIKVTYPADLKMAEAILKSHMQES